MAVEALAEFLTDELAANPGAAPCIIRRGSAPGMNAKVTSNAIGPSAGGSYCHCRTASIAALVNDSLGGATGWLGRAASAASTTGAARLGDSSLPIDHDTHRDHHHTTCISRRILWQHRERPARDRVLRRDRLGLPFQGTHLALSRHRGKGRRTRPPLRNHRLGERKYRHGRPHAYGDECHHRRHRYEDSSRRHDCLLRNQHHPPEQVPTASERRGRRLSSANLQTPARLRCRHGAATSRAPSTRPLLPRAPAGPARSTTAPPGETTTPLSRSLQRRPTPSRAAARERAHDRAPLAESARTACGASQEGERPDA